MTPTTQPAPIPSPLPFYFSTDLTDDEADVDLDEDDDLDRPSPPSDDDDTRVETIEFMGSGYTSLSAYFCSQLEDHISEPIQWILTTLDMALVQRRFEGKCYRYILEGTAVYRTGLRASPKPTPGDDPPGPWMPTRGF